MRIRIKFEKLDRVKFISHLDLLKTFQRALRRAGIKVKYSQGFNPHMIINIARPLSVGFTSSCEFMDVVVEEDKTLGVIKQSLNDTLPEGINVLDIILLNEYNDCPFKNIKYAVYEIELEIDPPVNFEEGYRSLAEITVIKKEKKTDLKPLISYLYITQSNEKVLLEAKLEANNDNTLNPQLLVRALEENIGFVTKSASYRRLHLVFEV